EDDTSPMPPPQRGIRLVSDGTQGPAIAPHAEVHEARRHRTLRERIVSAGPYLLLGLVVACCVAVRLPRLYLPGPYPDEIAWAYMAMVMHSHDVVGFPALTIGITAYFLTLAMYHGAFPSY